MLVLQLIVLVRSLDDPLRVVELVVGIDRQLQLRQHALENPGVNAVLEVLKGEIVEIRPLTGGFSTRSGDAT